MGTRIKDFESRFHLAKTFSDRGFIGAEEGYGRRGETSLRLVVEDAISGNSIQVQGRLKDQAAWQDVGSPVTSANLTGASIDISNHDEFRFKCLAFMGAGSVSEIQTFTPSAAPDAGAFKFNFGGEETAAIAFDATADEIRDAIRAALPGLDLVTVSGTLATAVVVTFVGYKGNAALMTITDNTLEASAVAVTLPGAQTTAGVAGADNKLICSGFYS